MFLKHIKIILYYRDVLQDLASWTNKQNIHQSEIKFKNSVYTPDTLQRIRENKPDNSEVRDNGL